jgi:hypothetical protein
VSRMSPARHLIANDDKEILIDALLKNGSDEARLVHLSDLEIVLGLLFDRQNKLWINTGKLSFLTLDKSATRAVFVPSGSTVFISGIATSDPRLVQDFIQQGRKPGMRCMLDSRFRDDSDYERPIDLSEPRMKAGSATASWHIED